MHAPNIVANPIIPAAATAFARREFIFCNSNDLIISYSLLWAA
ncbi:hypothetical protein TREAZ_2360 [Leadbettera azotonutricia ZAS-9]|uniref:Uncharacterized protein n=1 Tax=Leadbettera azotonutricia (strain ATCC BAA-888 / DSM 13862 / ZAS-9) TaxID=545695 RepID=F5YGF7_LEAAZ|nr:hypothetical protein TREAZ_2360 [Leadbettera azotonutricia ZAS-9]